MIFEFDNELMPMAKVEIPEVGEFGLEAISEDGVYHYMVVKTMLGITTISTCGPVIPDVDALPSGFRMTLDKLNYREDKVGKVVNGFLNDKYRKITEAKLIDVNDAINQFRELKDYLKNYREETF